MSDRSNIFIILVLFVILVVGIATYLKPLPAPVIVQNHTDRIIIDYPSCLATVVPVPSYYAVPSYYPVTVYRTETISSQPVNSSLHPSPTVDTPPLIPTPTVTATPAPGNMIPTIPPTSEHATVPPPGA